MAQDAVSPEQEPVAENPLSYTRLSDIFRSWFWRYYDHLGHLVFYNFLWSLSLLPLGYIIWRAGFLKTGDNINLLGVYALYLVSCAVSVGWSYSVFRLVNTGQTSFADVWTGTRKFFVKAFLVSAVSGMVMGLALFNIRFYLHWSSEHGPVGFLLCGLLLWILFAWIETALYHWPILFFQNPPILKIFYKSLLVILDNGWTVLRILLFFLFWGGLFTLPPFIGWLFLGFSFFFSLQCVALEKHYLKYRITYEDRPLPEVLEALERERQRGWREFWRPWENR